MVIGESSTKTILKMNSNCWSSKLFLFDKIDVLLLEKEEILFFTLVITVLVVTYIYWWSNIHYRQQVPACKLRIVDKITASIFINIFNTEYLIVNYEGVNVRVLIIRFLVTELNSVNLNSTIYLCFRTPYTAIKNGYSFKFVATTDTASCTLTLLLINN